MRPLVGQGRIRERGGAVSPPASITWGGGEVTFDSRRWTCDDAEIEWTSPHHLIVLTEAGGTATTEVRVDGGRAYDGRDAPGALSFIPAGASRYGAYRRADMSYAAIWIAPETMDRLAGRPFRAPAPFVNGEDPVVAALLRGLRDDAAAGLAPSAAYAEHAVALMAMRLASREGARPAPREAPGGLSRRELARIADHVDAHLAEDVSLADLAALARMPVDRFARRFRAATGLAPYAYVLERRVRAAERMLAASELSIAEIAFALGFSSQSHFTTVFRRRNGATPQAWRRAAAPGS
ncbi:helix-turn-helix domain-containing protein [Methylopila henanensis]|uniref:Helix-turn-helix domain-containing protein n=1 Tax=Methylopila henanensis TaxID=873516 RepID=A0ABW4K1M3_9HYPH